MRFLLPLLFVIVQVFAQPVSYPLHIGDIWQYRNAAVMTPDTFVYSYKALSDTLIAGKMYTVTFFNNNPVSVQRQSGDSVFLYRSGFDKEFVYFDFSRTVGDTISTTAFGNDTMDVVLAHTGVANYFGTSRRTWTFYVNASRRSIDDEFSVTVADGLGTVQNVPSFGDPMALVGAVVNGTQYGVILSVQKFQQVPPSDFRLVRNFPNPFNPATTIRFILPQSSQVTLEVYNNIGQILHRRHYSQVSAGSHDLHFDASGLPSGTYYYRVLTEFGVATGKMLLTR